MGWWIRIPQIIDCQLTSPLALQDIFTCPLSPLYLWPGVPAITPRAFHTCPLSPLYLWPGVPAITPRAFHTCPLSPLYLWPGVTAIIPCLQFCPQFGWQKVFFDWVILHYRLKTKNQNPYACSWHFYVTWTKKCIIQQQHQWAKCCVRSWYLNIFFEHVKIWTEDQSHSFVPYRHHIVHCETVRFCKCDIDYMWVYVVISFIQDKNFFLLLWDESF